MHDTEIEDSALGAVVADELRQAQSFDQSKRVKALEYMRGEMSDLPARTNGSSQTSRDVNDTLSWILPGVVRVFAQSDQMVTFEATQEGGEQGAEEASEYTNYSFWRENPGYQVLYNATYDSLLMGNGAACSYWCPEEDKTQLFRDKTEDEIASLLEEGWEGMGSQPKPGRPIADYMPDEMTGEMIEVEIPTFTLRLRKVTKRGQIEDMTMKPENLRINSSATTIENARMVAYLHDDKTRSDLVKMADDYGWDAETIENLPAHSARGTGDDSGVGVARNPGYFNRDDSPVRSGDQIELYEVYLRADEDGDGIAEMLRIWYAGDAGQGRILSHEEWEDDIPFTDIPCYPVPHRWEAESVYDRTADIQRVKTVLLRGGIDNIYAVNMPMREVEEGSVLNPDILVNPKFNGLIWKKRGAMPIVPHVIPYIADKAFMALEYMDTMIAKRTGVSKTTMALDPDTFTNQTATSVQLQRDASYSQIELIARNMAELGWSKFFDKRRRLAQRYIKEPVKIPSRNGDAPPQPENEGEMPGQPSKYRTIQPEQWSDDMAVTINVGLGTGSKDRDMTMLQSILNTQMNMADRLAAGGMRAKAIEFVQKIRKTAVEMADSSGLKNPSDYYPEFSDEEMAGAIEAANQPPGPDPQLALEQAKGEVQKELKTVDAQVTMQTEQAKLAAAQQAEALQSEAQVRREQAQLEADLATKEADRQNAIAIEQQRQAFEREKMRYEYEFRLQELTVNTELEREKMTHAALIASMKPAPVPTSGKERQRP